MPSLSDKYDVLLEFTNDTTETVTVQLLRDYGRSGGGTVLLNSYDSLTLVLESGTAYRYAIKMRTRVVSITASTWRNAQCSVSQVFSSQTSTPSDSSHSNPCITVDGLFRDFRTSIWSES